MLKEHAAVFRGGMLIVDLLVLAAAFWLAYFLTSSRLVLYPFATYVWFQALFLFVWCSALAYFNMYDSFRVRRLGEMLSIVMRSGFSGFLVMAAFIFMFQPVYVSRILTASSFVLATLLLGIEKALLVAVFRYTRRSGYNYRRLLIVGTGQRARRFIDRVQAHVEWGFRIVGLVDEDPELVNQTVKGFRVIGTLNDIPRVIHETVVDDIVFVVPRSWLARIEPVMNYLEAEGLKVSVAVDFFDLSLSHAKATDFDGVPLLSFSSTTDKIWHLVVKRMMDVAIAGTALMLLSPAVLCLALLIRVTSDGPAFFTQERCGLNGRRFKFYKFRTMIRNAEAKLPELMAQNEMEGPVFKMSKDPRVTRLGSFLRKTSLDEVPQLWNVLVGDMSLVGPRPPLPVEVQRYDHWQRRKLSMRPGVTCLWQINGRNNIKNFNDWVKLDLSYIDNWSLGLDWKILFKTIPVVMMGIGAK